MIAAATVRSRLVLRIRDASRASGVAPFEATSGIMLTPVSKPDSPSTSSGNAMRAGSSRPPGPLPACGQGRQPVRDGHRVLGDLHQARGDHHGVESEKDRHERDRDVDGLGEAQQEHAAEDQQQDHGDRHGLPRQRRQA